MLGNYTDRLNVYKLLIQHYHLYFLENANTNGIFFFFFNNPQFFIGGEALSTILGLAIKVRVAGIALMFSKSRKNFTPL